MRMLLQRVTNATVVVDKQQIAAIKQGLLVFVGIEKQDEHSTTVKMIDKLLNYRIFADSESKMNLNVQQVPGAGILFVPQFTLAADTTNGLRPSFSTAKKPQIAKKMFEEVIALVTKAYPNLLVATGEFGADMQVQLVNDGPVTFLLEV